MVGEVNWSYLEAWSFVAEVLADSGDTSATAFFTSPGRAVTVARVVPPTGRVRLRVAGSDAEIEGHVLGTASPLTVLECEGGSGSVAWREPAPVGAHWQSFSFVSTPNMPFRVVGGSIARRHGDRLLLEYEGSVDFTTSLAGAPLVVDGGIAGVILSGPAEGFLEAAPSDVAHRVLSPWLGLTQDPAFQAEHAASRDVLRRCVHVLTEAKVTESTIARQASFTSGYIRVLLQENGPRLTEQVISRLVIAIDILAKEAGDRITEPDRTALRRDILTLKSTYAAVTNIVRPGRPLKPTATNYVHRRIDGLLAEDLVGHNSFMVDGVLGPPYCGKTWAIEQLAFAAADTHEVFHVDLSMREPNQPVEVRFVQELRAVRANLGTDREMEPFTPSGPIRVTVLATELLALLAAARGAAGLRDRRLLVLVDGPDRAGDPNRLLSILRELLLKTRYFPGLSDVWLVVTSCEAGGSETASSVLRPTWGVSYFDPEEVRRLFELHQEGGLLREWSWSDLAPEVERLGGHPGLVACFFDDCRQLGRQATAAHTISPEGSGHGLLEAQCRRFVSAWLARQPRSFRQHSRDLVGSENPVEELVSRAAADDSLWRLLYRFGLLKGDMGHPGEPAVLCRGAIVNPLRRALAAELGSEDTGGRFAVMDQQSFEPGPGLRRSELSPPTSAFIVHGRDPKNRRHEVARFVERCTGLRTVVIDEQRNAGRTLIEKLRDHAAIEVVAIVILTADDVGRLATSDPTADRPRARQNVILELGYFIAKLPPERTIVLRESDLDTPSDFDGVAYVSLDDGRWRSELARELAGLGVAVDANRL